MSRQAFELLDFESGYRYSLETATDILPSNFTLVLPERNGTLALTKDVDDLSGKLVRGDIVVGDSKKLDGKSLSEIALSDMSNVTLTPEVIDSLRGYTGSAGTAGPIGLQGGTGYTGSAGANGATGYIGSVGFTGSKGADGVAGSAGPIGTQGYTGSKGDTGATGPQGPSGAVASTTLNAIGSHVLARAYSSPGTPIKYTYGENVSGSYLYPTSVIPTGSIILNGSPTSLPGTWKALSQGQDTSTYGSIGLFVRIA